MSTTDLVHPDDPGEYADLALELASNPGHLGLNEETRWSLAGQLHRTGREMAEFRRRDVDVLPAPPTETTFPQVEYRVTDVEAFPAVSPWLYALAYFGFPSAVLLCAALGFVLYATSR